ncbi:hypothetical protein [Vibrio diazotrophicus]|uniref:hypothetical protein n=1 Tax=Vibrio diazotrophicus TaxID=685 RepID=UPI000C9E66D8|nr:hypothetical protein [Vibrio diazotrophicus]PNH91363.1 hypothetical protein C1M59_14780 [Vibrio diazotrophicus]
MYINKAISFHGGWDILQSKNEAFAEIKLLLNKVSYSSLSKVEIKASSAFLSGKVRHTTISRQLRTEARRSGWYQANKDRKQALLPDIELLKYGVSLDFTFTIGTNLERYIDRWSLVETTRDQNYDECNLNILIVSDSVPPWLHLTLYQNDSIREYNSQTLINYLETRVLPLYHSYPMVILTVSEENSSIELIELKSDTESPTVERVLEFTPENYQAGVAILSYFGEILKQKYPDIEAKVTIEQDDCVVRMTIDTPDGNQEIIEEALNTYTQVVVKEREPEELLDNKIQISELKMQLSMIETQLEHKKELLMLADERYKRDVIETRNEVDFLRQCIKSQMQLTHQSQKLIGQQISKEEKITLAQICHQENTIQALLDQSSTNTELFKSLSYIQSLVEGSVSKEDEGTSKVALETIHQESPTTFQQLYKLLENSMYGVSGNIIFTWMTEIAKQLA